MVRPLPALLSAIAGRGQYPGLRLTVTLPILGTGNEGGSVVIATFGPTTGWLGKTIAYENGQFALEGLGPISAQHVLEYDRQGHLQWAYEGLPEWVQQLVPGER